MTRHVHIIPAKPDDAEAIARVHVDSWRVTYRGIVPDSVLDSLDVASRADVWRRAINDTITPQRVQIAVIDSREVAGFVASGRERTGDFPDYTGEIYAIYLTTNWQGIGLGRDLFLAGIHALREQGHEAILLWALTENPSCGFYRRMGGNPIATQLVTMGQKTLEETAFGWQDLSIFLEDD